MCARQSYNQWVTSCGMIFLPIFRDRKMLSFSKAETNCSLWGITQLGNKHPANSVIKNSAK